MTNDFDDSGGFSDGGGFSDNEFEGSMMPQSSTMTPNANNTQPNAPLLDDNVKVNLRNSWTALYEIQGVGRSPIKLKTY